MLSRSSPPDECGYFRVSLRDMVTALSLALDAADTNSITQHRMIAYIATRVALRLGLSKEAMCNIYLASLVSDIGSMSESNPWLDQGNAIPGLRQAIVGARQLEILPQLREPASIIRYHALPWTACAKLRRDGVNVPVESAILNLARWVCVTLGTPGNVLAAVPALDPLVRDGRGTRFHPHVVDAYLALAEMEGFWLDLYSTRLERILMRFQLPEVFLDAADIEKLAWVFSLIIDGRSRFTATHSSGVSASAVAIAKALAWDARQFAPMRVAGLLHDIGKLTVSNAILDKRGSLDDTEWAMIKGHTFHTTRILEVVHGFEDVARWAGDHHETLNGSGYPFHKQAEDIPLGSRILALGDIFTALAEDRPYRSGLKQPEVARIIRRGVRDGLLDARVTECLLDNYTLIDACRAAHQEGHRIGISGFWRATADELQRTESVLA